MKKKLYVIGLILLLITCASGITYSFFNSNTSLNSNNLKVAGFIFNAEKTDHIELPIIDLLPGSNQDYLFAISNNYQGNRSDVSIEYQLEIRTIHLVPLVIKLYKTTINGDELLITCNESEYTRISDNELICNSLWNDLPYNDDLTDNYKLTVEFDNGISSSDYAGLVDYINVEITSRQK